jgi:hypothetical protein
LPGGSNSRLVTFSGGDYVQMNTQWTGDWTAARITKISMYTRNPNPFDMRLWLGIAGPLGSGVAGSLDTFVTNSYIDVPNDNHWHFANVSVLPSAFSDWGTVGTIEDALANVYQFRIAYSPTRNWQGDAVNASLFLDNIRALPEPSSLTLLAIAATFGCSHRLSRRLLVGNWPQQTAATNGGRNKRDRSNF